MNLKTARMIVPKKNNFPYVELGEWKQGKKWFEGMEKVSRKEISEYKI